MLLPLLLFYYIYIFFFLGGGWLGVVVVFGLCFLCSIEYSFGIISLGKIESFTLIAF